MDPEQSKALIQQFFHCISTGRSDEAFASLADDFTFELIAPEPYGGTYTRDGLAKFYMEVMAPAMAKPFSTVVLGMVAEGDRVAVESVSDCENHAGFHYRNRYHSLFQLKNGQIVFLREYLDSAHLLEFLHPQS